MIYIPTLSRPHHQPTLKAITDANFPVVLVVQPQEEHLYKKYESTLVSLVVLPEGLTGIGNTRQWIMDGADSDEHILMFDDDLAFACRGKRVDNQLYLSDSSPDDVRRMLQWMEWKLSTDAAICGISAREGNNRKEEPTEQCARMMRAWGIRKDKFVEVGARFDRIDMMEDFDVILQFIKAGYPNIINNEVTTNQAGSNTAGGMSTYRTLERQAAAAHALHALHPDVVTVVQKETKTSWGGGVRTDVRVQWKKALPK